MIAQSIWKKQPAWTLENSHLKVAVLPELGGKIASFFSIDANTELAAQSLREYRKPLYGADFSEYDASGFDDCFPCVMPSVQQIGGKSVQYPDHGEIWLSGFDCEVQNDTLYLQCESLRMPYRYEKKIRLDGSCLHLDYRITNTGGQAFPCMWLFHGLVKYRENMRLLYPRNTTYVRNVLEHPQLGKPDTVQPMKQDGYDFIHVPPEQPNSMMKYYIEGPVEEGCCGYEYPDENVRFRILFPQNHLPYLGVWITAGGYRGDYNCAFEPGNAFYDCIDIARANNALPVLQPGKQMQFSLCLEAGRLA